MIDELKKLIIELAVELSDQEEIELVGELTEDTELFGPNGVLDSMGLGSLVVAVEQAVEENYDVRISLADEKALSQHHSPYRTMATLAEYAAAEIQAK